MAVYKVIQDVEAEDKLLGPLTLKGFIYAAIAGLLAFINVRLLLASTLGPARWLFILLFLFPMLLFAILASPLGREQPTEVWLLSRVRFLIKPRQRIWDQSGISQLVTITVPKKIEKILTKGFSQTEVKSRLQALATTLDSHGWAVKNVNVNLSEQPDYLDETDNPSDRLVQVDALAKNEPTIDVQPADDILDEKNNPTAQKFESLIKQAETVRKQGLFERLKSVVDHDEPKPKARHDEHKHHSKKQKTAEKDPIKKTWDEDTLRKNKALQRRRYEKTHEDPHLNERLSQARQTFETTRQQEDEDEDKASVTAKRQAVNMELAQSGSDLSVASIEHLANHKNPIRQQQIGPNEVVVSLH